MYYALVAALIAPIDRSDFPADYHFNLANPKITPGASGTSPNLLIHTAREDFPFRNTALAGHLARLVSIALSALTFVGVFGVARRLLRDERLALLATAIVAFIPQFVYGAAIVNNDALAACAATWLFYALLRLMDDDRWRWARLSGVLLGLTLLAKIGMIAVLPIPALALVADVVALTQPRAHVLRSTLLLGVGDVCGRGVDCWLVVRAQLRAVWRSVDVARVAGVDGHRACAADPDRFSARHAGLFRLILGRFLAAGRSDVVADLRL